MALAAPLPPKARSCNLDCMDEIVFEVTQEDDGGYVAECLTESIVTQADEWEALRQNVKEAVVAFYFDSPAKPARIRFHHVRDEVLT
ncbi:MAG TPA: 2-phospho-L-lactate guanylyltransferase [Terriglobia bacterium]|nr:2-phospho-L-lactate guanylyltransferase [Terriglobia bacterium]